MLLLAWLILEDVMAGLSTNLYSCWCVEIGESAIEELVAVEFGIEELVAVEFGIEEFETFLWWMSYILVDDQKIWVFHWWQ